MKIKSVAIENYKSFAKSGPLAFSEGFNTIVGANNSGKTALIESISLQFVNSPHRSELTMPSIGDSPPGSSRVRVSLEVTSGELRSFLWPAHAQFNVVKNPSADDAKASAKVIEAFSADTFTLECVIEPSNLVSARLKGIDAPVKAEKAFQLSLDTKNAEPSLLHKNVSAGENDLASFLLAQSLMGRIYLFRAERLNVGQYNFGASTELAQDASNLAQVLNVLQTSNPERFKRLVGLVTLVFPDIKQITVPPTPDSSGQVRISVWSIPVDSEREDLALPLQESGTGVGQVLAILYVAITSDMARTILIDEPQSFLHPGAIRKLFDILRQYFGRHQYIVTTHSPIVVSSGQPGSLILLRKHGLETNAELIDADQAGDMRVLLGQVGARLSDVFGADNILWVEGQTEELCFPEIFGRMLKRPLQGTKIVAILNVGDLRSKQKETVLRIYRRLSGGSALIPPATAFILDRESRSEDKLADLEREGKGQIKFLSKRMYENYLIDPSAIAAILNDADDCVDDDISSDQVVDWIENNRGNESYGIDTSLDLTQGDAAWTSKVDGARILKDLFLAFSDHRCEYDKVAHGYALTTWLIDNNPHALEEVASQLNEIIPATPEVVEAA